jgi:hypothetical protein
MAMETELMNLRFTIYDLRFGTPHPQPLSPLLGDNAEMVAPKLRRGSAALPHNR